MIDLKRNNFKLFCFFVLIILGIPIILNVLFLCKAGPDGWASYFGSYLGGLLGGVATFLGVYITIKNNKEEQDRKVKIERLEKILNSAIIISFDLGFLLNNIKDFLSQTSQYRIKEGKEFIEAFQDAKENLNQFYFNAKWIETVATLGLHPKIEKDDMELIYELYGYFSNIANSISSDKEEICVMAYQSMKNIMEPDSRGDYAYKRNKRVEDLEEKLHVLIYEIKKEII